VLWLECHDASYEHLPLDGRDLLVAIVYGLIFVEGIFEPTTLLVALVVVAAELGVVSWLGLRNEEQLVKD